MLSLSLLTGEYLTIGGKVVLQYTGTRSGRCHLNITAPREVAILRGEVHERAGGQRPDCLVEKPVRFRKELPWDRNKARALNAMRGVLAEMEETEQVRELRRQLEHIFPTSAT